MSIIDDNYKELAMTIVKQAAEDYRAALLSDKNSRTSIIKENEQFFRSNWFKILAPKLNGEFMITRLRESANDFKQKSDEAFDNNILSVRIRSGYQAGTHAFLCPICQGHVFTSYRKLNDIVTVLESNPDNLSKTGEKWGYRAICSVCHLCYNSRRETRMLDTPIPMYKKNVVKDLAKAREKSPLTNKEVSKNKKEERKKERKNRK